MINLKFSHKISNDVKYSMKLKGVVETVVLQTIPLLAYLPVK